MPGFQNSPPLSIGGSITPLIFHSGGAAPANIVETGVPFHVHTQFTVTGAGAIALGGKFKVNVSFEGLGASAPEVDLATETVKVVSSPVAFPGGVPTRSYNVVSNVPLGFAVPGAYEMIATVTHVTDDAIPLPGPIAGYSDEQIVQFFPNSPATTP